jgi:electron transfer flavoprotein beta subunit
VIRTCDGTVCARRSPCARRRATSGRYTEGSGAGGRAGFTFDRGLVLGALVKILVCLKQVPAKDVPLKLNAAATWIREDVSYETNEPDAYALEEALRQKEAHGGEVVALTVGPARAAQVLREALAKGADRALHVLGDEAVQLDSYASAEAIARAVPGEKFDLIFTGLQSDDYGSGQVGVVLAELLGLPHATIIMQIEPAAGGIRVKREMESGYFQFLELPLPAVLTIQSGINKLRYATLMGIKQAKNKPLQQIPVAEIGVSAALNRQKIERLYIPQKTKKTEILDGSPRDAAAKLADRLMNEARAL